MPFLHIDSGRIVEVSQTDYDWIAERMNTSCSGTVSFTSAAVRRYRKITGQEHEAGWKVRAQMLNEFGHLA